MSVLVVAHPGRPAYGAEELKRAAHRYGFLALTISALIHFSVIGSYYFAALVDTDVPKLDPPKPWGREVAFHRTPLIPGIRPLQPRAGATLSKSVFKGTPVPVDDPERAEATTASQEDLAESVDPDLVGEVGGDQALEQLGEMNEEAPPDTFRAIEKEPAVVKAVAPIYPALALKAGLEGRVFVKIWVDRRGRVRDVVVVRSNNDIFNEAAIEAAKQFVFTPAYMNNGPVPVWVAMPFTFRLTGSQ